MLLTAVVTKAELAALVESLVPLQIVIDERRGRALTLGCSGVDLVPERGLYLQGDARVAWDVAGVPITVAIQSWRLVLSPRIVARRGARLLAFEPVLEELDLKLVPSFLGDKVAGVITDALAHNRAKLAWDFARTLSKSLPLSTRIQPPRTFELNVVDGTVVVGADDVVFSVRLAARVEERQRMPAESPEGVRPAPFVSARAPTR